MKKNILDNHKTILKVALEVNKRLYDDGLLSYQMYKHTEDKILKELEMD